MTFDEWWVECGACGGRSRSLALSAWEAATKAELDRCVAKVRKAVGHHYGLSGEVVVAEMLSEGGEHAT